MKMNITVVKMLYLALPCYSTDDLNQHIFMSLYVFLYLPDKYNCCQFVFTHVLLLQRYTGRQAAETRI